MEKQHEISGKKHTGSNMSDFRSSFEIEIPVVVEKRRALEALDMNGYIRRLVQSISPTLKKRMRLRDEICDGDLPVLANPARITTIFAVLSACAMRLAPGGRITVLTALVPSDAGLIGTGNGCALLSFQGTGRNGQEIADLSVLGQDRMLPALFNVRQIVAGDHGCFRLCAGGNSIAFNVYLPVVGQSSVSMTESRAVFEGRQEGEPWMSQSYEKA